MNQHTCRGNGISHYSNMQKKQEITIISPPFDNTAVDLLENFYYYVLMIEDIKEFHVWKK